MQIQQIQKRLPLIIALACGILAILLLNVYLKQREGEIWTKIKQIQQQAQAPPAPRPQEMGIVLVARNDIVPQTPITPNDLFIKEIPVEYIQPGVVNSLEQVIGQISSVPINAGEQILKTKLLPPGKIGKTLSEITPEGKRALTVSLDNVSGIVGLIKPGNYVDVNALISVPSGVKPSTPPGTAAETAITSTPRLVPLFQNIEVLAVGSEFTPVSATPDSQRQKKGETAAASYGNTTVTLALSPQEAALLSFVQEHGKIKLTLRSSEDTKKESIRPADWDTLFRYLYPERNLDAEGKRSVVEVYRGLNKEVVPLTEKEKE